MSRQVTTFSLETLAAPQRDGSSDMAAETKTPATATKPTDVGLRREMGLIGAT